jgi:hypothetical protein
VTSKQTLSWAVPDAAGNTLALQWHMQTASTGIVLASRSTYSGAVAVATEKPTKNSTESSQAWTCAYFSGELWVISAKGTIGKFAVPSAISSILITQETTRAADCGTVGTLIISCAMGVFLQLTLCVAKDSCVLQASRELSFRSLGHSISPTTGQRGNLLLPSYQAMVPFHLPHHPGSRQPEVFLACHDSFGVDIISLGTSLLLLLLPKTLIVEHVSSTCSFSRA